MKRQFPRRSSIHAIDSLGCTCCSHPFLCLQLPGSPLRLHGQPLSQKLREIPRDRPEILFPSDDPPMKRNRYCPRPGPPREHCHLKHPSLTWTEPRLQVCRLSRKLPFRSWKADAGSEAGPAQKPLHSWPSARFTSSSSMIFCSSATIFSLSSWLFPFCLFTSASLDRPKEIFCRLSLS